MRDAIFIFGYAAMLAGAYVALGLGWAAIIGGATAMAMSIYGEIRDGSAGTDSGRDEGD